jgi:hypothetical protein
VLRVQRGLCPGAGGGCAEEMEIEIRLWPYGASL